MAATDEVLLAQAARGERAAFDQLVVRHQSAIYHFALRFCGHREDARELAQEIFVRVYLKLSTFRPGASFRPWLYRIATNHCLNAAARRRPVVRSLSPEGEDEPAIDPPGDPRDDPARQVPARLAAATVHQAIVTLPPAYRAVMILRHLEALDYQEIATVLDLPLGTVKTHLHRARQQLQARLDEAGEVP